MKQDIFLETEGIKIKLAEIIREEKTSQINLVSSGTSTLKQLIGLLETLPHPDISEPNWLKTFKLYNLSWYWQLPRTIYSRGMTLLAVRWCSLMGCIANPASPQHPQQLKKVFSPWLSYITDEEMMTLNLEVSSNLDYLFKLHATLGTKEFCSLLAKAVYYLDPLGQTFNNPLRKSPYTRKRFYYLWAFYLDVQNKADQLSHSLKNEHTELHALSDVKSFINEHSQNPISNVENYSRVIANFAARNSWRRTITEEIHIGIQSVPLNPSYNRFSPTVMKQWMSEISTNFTSIYGIFDTMLEYKGYDHFCSILQEHAGDSINPDNWSTSISENKTMYDDFHSSIP